MKLKPFFFSLLLLSNFPLLAQSNFEINLKPKAEIPTTLYGIFFEDINFGADGGLYAELVKNRSFEFPGNPLQGWKAFGAIEVLSDGPFPRNPHYVRLSQPDHPQKKSGLQNEGFFGMGIKGGEEYRFSFWGRVPEGGNGGSLTIEIINPYSIGSQAIATTEVDIYGEQWNKYEVELNPEATVEKAQLRIFLSSPDAKVDIEHISLFPKNTWKGRENGLRNDLAQALYDLHPGFFRFPGGCIVEGTDLETRYKWKNSVGPVENRPLNQNRWQYTFTDRFYPDYYQSYGLGFFELFQLSEDIGAEPLPIVSCGIACQFQNDDDSAHAPLDELDEYIQDALDLIEFANGDTSSEWGSVRASMGHPEPFNMKMIGIGNEQWGSLYPERLEPFVTAIRKAYPDIKIIGSAGADTDGEKFEYLWPEMRRIGVDLVDEHCYQSYEWFISNGDRYDSYDRKGPKVFVGEYACRGNQTANSFRSALAEAAFLTSVERNADIVTMSTYAPLFAHTEGWQWRPDLIWFDNLRVLKTTDWYVQQLYSQFRGKNVLELKCGGKNVTGQEGLFASAVSDGDLIYVKVINTSDSTHNVNLSFKGLKKSESIHGVKSVRFSSADPYDENSLDQPDSVIPIEEYFSSEGKTIPASIEPMTFRIFVLEK